tara:strand:- start:161 stop:2062 length:1902 start_codon:yes stop_codon:yes gene_type:complete
MCGIAGLIGRESTKFSDKVIEKLSHRGPDSFGKWQSLPNNYPVNLCHTRLNIIDNTNRGNQPLISKDQRYIFIFNGEIYNFIELRKDLEEKGSHFKTRTDTEVFMEGLIMEGPSFQLKCNGMWAFCLWDNKLNKAILGRDRFGVKPLYYSIFDDNALIFASEMKAITPFLNEILPSENIEKHLKNVFDYEYTNYCVINGIKRILPGNYVIYQDKIFKEYQYWNTLDNINFNKNSYQSQVDEWRELFLDSVKLRMRSDVKISSTLSGGLDSSSVVAAMKFLSKGNSPIQKNCSETFCSCYGTSDLDETKWAKKLSNALSINFNAVKINPKESPFSLLDSLAMVEDPYISLPHPMLQTYSAIKNKSIKVSIDGHGSDELFIGYGHIKKAMISSKNLSEFKELISINESTKSGIYSTKQKNIKRKWVRYKFLEYFKQSLNDLSINTNILQFNNDFKVKKNEVLGKARNHNCFEEMDGLTQALYEIFHFTTLPTLLRNYDKYSMANSVEVRMPFMDWRLVCFIFSLPLKSKLGKGFTKRIQRDALRGILQDDIRLRRDKIGWNSPSHEWFNTFLKDELLKLFTDNNSEVLRTYKDNAKTSFDKFLNMKNPNFNDGYKVWLKMQPFLWRKSLDSKIWR